MIKGKESQEKINIITNLGKVENALILMQSKNHLSQEKANKNKKFISRK